MNSKDRYTRLGMQDGSEVEGASSAGRALSTPSARSKWVSWLAGLAGPVLVPLLHIFSYGMMWQKYNRTVDRINCNCGCWDSVFKGNFEVGTGSYKHIYFNATANTFWIWSITVVGVIALYESGRHLCLLLLRGRVRWRLLALFCSNVYPVYYGWWMYFNYLNDDFYRQWWHQLYFTVTEVASCAAVFRLIDSRRPLHLRSLLLVLAVGLAHVLISAYDQAVANVFRGDGNVGQVLRDLGFLLPDLTACLVVVLELRQLARSMALPAFHLISTREFLVGVTFVASSWLLCLYL